jgi:hypothetical protein
MPSAVYKNFNNEVHAYRTMANKYGVIVAEADNYRSIIIIS